MQRWTKLPSSSVFFHRHVGADAIATHGATSSEDGRSEQSGLRRVAASRCSNEVQWGVRVRELISQKSIGRSQSEPLIEYKSSAHSDARCVASQKLSSRPMLVGHAQYSSSVSLLLSPSGLPLSSLRWTEEWKILAESFMSESM